MTSTNTPDELERAAAFLRDKFPNAFRSREVSPFAANVIAILVKLFGGVDGFTVYEFQADWRRSTSITLQWGRWIPGMMLARLVNLCQSNGLIVSVSGSNTARLLLEFCAVPPPERDRP